LFYRSLQINFKNIFCCISNYKSVDNFELSIGTIRSKNIIFAGVIGGLIAFGIVGLFIGPVILAVTYTLLKAWINEHKSETIKA
jgi:hypothetical protein